MNHEPLPQLEELDANFSFDESHRDKIYEAFRDLVRARRGVINDDDRVFEANINSVVVAQTS